MVDKEGLPVKSINDDSFLIFYDSAPLHPSLLLHNVLHTYLKEWRSSTSVDRQVLKIVLVKDKISTKSEAIPLDGSFYCEVVFEKEPEATGSTLN